MIQVRVEVGVLEQGKIKTPFFVITGDTQAVSRVLAKLDYEFQFIDHDGALIFREDRHGYRARYTVVQDHNSKEIPSP